MIGLAIIRIGIDPSLLQAGPVHLTWHGVFTFLGILTVVLIGARRAKGLGIDEDAIYNIAAAAIAAGIVGARLVHVIDFWSYYIANPLQVFNILSGGIGLIGGIAGATIGGALAIWWQKVPLGLALDAAAPGVPIGQMVGRIGDIINGEHFATATDLPWAFVYTHPNSPAFGMAPQHSAIAYEMVWDILIAAFLFWLFGRLRPPGMVFAAYAALYAAGRFAIQFLRLDAPYIGPLQEAHLLTLVIMAVAIPVLVARARWVPAGEDPYAEQKARALARATAASRKGDQPPRRRERRRRDR